MAEPGARSHPACINSSNPYHECSEYCFRRISENQAALETHEETKVNEPIQSEDVLPPPLDEEPHNDEPEISEEEYAKMSDRQKKLFDLRLKMNQARKANQGAVLAEKKREKQPEVSRGVSKQKWFEEKKSKMSKQLEANGLDMKSAFMLDTQEEAEAKYKKWEKKETPFGWDVFNQRSLYNAYKKRTKNIPYSTEDYQKQKESDAEFYRDESSLLYGNTEKIPEENIDKMVNELGEKENKRKEFSRRRKFHEDRDIDSINARNEHFNRKIERAFGKYTVEIKNNLERGTALPD